MSSPRINALCDQARALGSLKASLDLETSIYAILNKSHPDALYLIRDLMDIFHQHRITAHADFERASEALSQALKPDLP